MDTPSQDYHPYMNAKGIWQYYRLLKIKSLVYRDALFAIVSVPLVDKYQALTVYKIHNLSILYTRIM